MGASRQTQDIFFYIKNKKWKSAWYFIKHFNKTTYEDTVMPIVCKIIGHKPYQPDSEFEPKVWACTRCHQYIHFNVRKEKLKKINKKYA